MTPRQLDKFEQEWKRAFAISAGVLAVCLLVLLMFASTGTLGFVAYSIGGLAVVGCLYAAKKLRDVERANAAIDASVLRETYRPSDLGLHDD